MTFAFTPPTGLLDTSTYPTVPASETAARQQFMDLYNQLRDELNSAATSAIGIRKMAEQAFINGNFDVWQRGTTSTNPSNGTFLADHYLISYTSDGGTFPSNIIHSRQQHTSGDVPGAFYYYRINPDGSGTGYGTNASYGLFQRIENGTRFLCGAGKKITISFYARSSIAGKRIGVGLSQRYGTGGSPSANENITGTNQIVTLSATWTKYTVTFTTNTLVGKTFGTNNDDYLQVGLYSVWGATNATNFFGGGTAETFGGSGNIDVAQMQVNLGDNALPFQPRTFSEDLALCQRFYEKSYAYATSPGTATTTGALQFVTEDGTSTGAAYNYVPFKVPKRTTSATITIYGTGGTTSAINDETADRTVGSGTLATGQTEMGFQQNYTLSSPSSRRRRFHYTVSDEL